MNREEYLKKIKASIKVSYNLKNRIITDIETEVDFLLDEGKSMSEIMQLKGEPNDIAESFNRSYYGTDESVKYKNEKSKRNVGIILVTITVLLFAASFIAGLTNIDSTIVGGCSGPTVIMEGASYAFLNIASISLLISGCIILCASIVVLVNYIKTRSNI